MGHYGNLNITKDGHLKRCEPISINLHRNHASTTTSEVHHPSLAFYPIWPIWITRILDSIGHFIDNRGYTDAHNPYSRLHESIIQCLYSIRLDLERSSLIELPLGLIKEIKKNYIFPSPLMDREHRIVVTKELN